MSGAAPNRSLVAWSVISATCAGGAWLLCVAPMRAELSLARETLRAVRHELAMAEASAGDEPAGVDTTDPAGPRVEAINIRSVLARDSGALHHAVMAIAAREGVRVARVEPKSTVAASSAQRSDEGEAIALTIAAEGEYGAIVKFLDALEREAGYCIVRGAQLQPNATLDGALSASIDTTHHAYSTAIAPATDAGAPE